MQYAKFRYTADAVEAKRSECVELCAYLGTQKVASRQKDLTKSQQSLRNGVGWIPMLIRLGNALGVANRGSKKSSPQSVNARSAGKG